MPYTMSVEGMDETINMLRRLGSQAGSVAASGLYDGAGVMAKTIEDEAQRISAEPFHYAVFIQRKPSDEEKAAVANARVGIAKFDKTTVNAQTSVGYGKSGYANVAGKMKPVPKIANAINSGTSFMKKQPFFRRAVNSGTKPAQEAIIARIESRINELTNNDGGDET